MATADLTAEAQALVVAFELLRQKLGDTAVVMSAANIQRQKTDAFKQEAEEIAAAIAAHGKEQDQKAWKETAAGLDLAARHAPGAAGKALGAAGAIAGGANPVATGVNTGMDVLKSSPIIGVLDQVAGKFQSIIGPAGVIASVLQTATSGFQVLGTAVRVFAASLAPILLPFTTVISTAFVALGEVLSTLTPALDGFFDFILEAAVPAIEGFIEMVMAGALALKRFIASMPTISPQARAEKMAIDDHVEREMDKFDKERPHASDDEREKFEEATREWAKKAIESKGSKGTTTDTVMGAMRDVMQSLKQSVGPKASISSLEGLGQQVQLSALNQDPLEARIQKQLLATTERIESAINRYTAKRTGTGARVYDPPAVGRDDSAVSALLGMTGDGTAGGDYGEGG